MTVSLDWFGITCGVLPIGQEARVTTTGLEWNLGPTACTSHAIFVVHSYAPWSGYAHVAFLLAP